MYLPPTPSPTPFYSFQWWILHMQGQNDGHNHESCKPTIKMKVHNGPAADYETNVYGFTASTRCEQLCNTPLSLSNNIDYSVIKCRLTYSIVSFNECSNFTGWIKGACSSIRWCKCLMDETHTLGSRKCSYYWTLESSLESEEINIFLVICI